MNQQIKVELKDAEELWEFLQQHNIKGTWQDKISFVRRFKKYPYWNWERGKINRAGSKKEYYTIVSHSLFFKDFKDKYIWI